MCVMFGGQLADVDDGRRKGNDGVGKVGEQDDKRGECMYKYMDLHILASVELGVRA